MPTRCVLPGATKYFMLWLQQVKLTRRHITRCRFPRSPSFYLPTFIPQRLSLSSPHNPVFRPSCFCLHKCPIPPTLLHGLRVRRTLVGVRKLTLLSSIRFHARCHLENDTSP